MIQNPQSSRYARWVPRTCQALASSMLLANNLIGLAGPHWMSGTAMPSGLGQPLLLAAIRLVVMAVIALRDARRPIRQDDSG